MRKKRFTGLAASDIVWVGMLGIFVIYILCTMESAAEYAQSDNPLLHEVAAIIRQRNMWSCMLAFTIAAGIFHIFVKRKIRMIQGSERVGTLSGRDVDREAVVMRRWIMNKAGHVLPDELDECEAMKQFAMSDQGAERLTLLLRLVHSLGYKIVIRRVSDESIERNAQAAAKAAREQKPWKLNLVENHNNSTIF